MVAYPTWKDDTPHTDTKATIRSWRRVVNVRVIRVEEASYRSALLSGTFQLEDQCGANPVETTHGGKLKASVVCAWHGVTPPTCYPHLDLSDGQYEIIEHFTGDVADNIC